MNFSKKVPSFFTGIQAVIQSGNRQVTLIVSILWQKTAISSRRVAVNKIYKILALTRTYTTWEAFECDFDRRVQRNFVTQFDIGEQVGTVRRDSNFD